ncbi:MAG TPA: NACHT domain-containing protein, partial [Puia sp.]|nr:NACHT domain-containing protein [Puia sp.]
MSIKNLKNALPLCLYGVGGIGKSTVARNLHEGLPVGSVTILFDCYGGSRFSESHDRRHKHEKAFLFLCNELALRTGAPFLLAHGRGNDYYLNEFGRRLEIASELLNKSTPSAILSIVIDAADNAVTAATQYLDDCFVHDLVNITFPANCRLILTTRTHRLGSLKLPQLAKKIEIEPFSQKETKAFLLNYLLQVTDGEVKEFRELSRGIPRVMSYTMAGAGNTLAEKVKPLQPKGKDLDDIFFSFLITAQRKSGENLKFDNLIKFLTLLPRPIPLTYLEKVSTLDIQYIHDVVTDLGNGLILGHELLRFKDEDFEAFLRKNYPPDVATYTVIAALFHDHADQDDYASTHLGYFLACAGRYKDLQSITVERKFLNEPQDPVRQREVFIERARLAMKHASIQEDRLQFLQLQAVSAEASKTNKVLEEIILSNPELASAFGSAETNRKMYFQSGNFQWHGKVHLRSAAVLSRELATHAQAKEHMKSAEAWIRFRSSLDDERLREFNISETDLSFGGEAYLRLFGIQHCARWFERWNPKTFVYDSLDIFIRQILTGSTKKEIQQWLGNGNPRADVKLLINQVFFEQSWTPPYPASDFIPKLELIKRASRKLNVQLMESLVSFAEQQFRYNSSSSKEIIKILDCIVTKFPTNLPSFYKSGYRMDEDLEHLDLHFRTYVLQHTVLGTPMKVDDFLPARLLVDTGNMKYKERQYIGEEKGKYLSFFRHLLPAYQLRLEMLGKRVRTKSIEKKLGAILRSFDSDLDISYRHRFSSRYFARYLALKLMDGVFYLSQPETAIEQIKKNLKPEKGERIDLYLKLANRLAGTERFQKSALLLLEDADKQIEGHGLSGSSQLEYYTEAAIIASKVSKLTGKTYFDKLVNASSAIDREAHDQIVCVTNIMKSADFLDIPQLSFTFARYVEYCADRLSDYEDFPWDHAFEAITRMHIPTAFSVLCRWDHRRVRKSAEHISELMELSLQTNFIGHASAASLLPLNPYYWENYISLLKGLLQKYDDAVDRVGKITFVGTVIHDLKISCNGRHHWRVMLKALDLFKQGKFSDDKVITELDAYCSGIKEILGVKEKEQTEEDSIKSLLKSAKERSPKIKFTGYSLATVKGLEALLSSRGIDKLEYRNYDVDAILSQVMDAVKPSQYVAHLEALVKVNPDQVGYWSFEEALAQRLRAWTVYPEVKEWKKKNFGTVLSSRFFHYVRYDDYFQTSSVKKLADLFEVSDKEVADILFSILPDYISDLSAGVLYQLFSFSVAGTEPSIKRQFLEWVIPRWAEKIAPDFGDGPFNLAFAPADNPQIVLSQFLRYHLGHPDKRTRWRAAKALIRLSDTGNIAVIDQLINSQNLKDCGAFQHRPHTFYWIAAKLWLWIVIHKISINHPEKLRHLSAVALKELKNPELPHIQLRWFIQAFCLNLHKKFNDIYGVDEQQQINSILKSKFRKVKKKGTTNPQPRGRKKLRFDFDRMDTVDHWFEPLGRDFGLSGWEIAELAEKYIIDKWGFSGDVRDQDHVRNDREEDYDLISHYKFDIPVIEDLRTYYEYHSMQCVAGDLIATKPLCKIESYYREWDEWWPRFTLTWPDEWLYEFLDPVPVEKKFWIEKSHLPDWEWNIQRKDFDELIGFTNPMRQGYLHLQGAGTIYHGRDYENFSVRSALVQPELAPSLLKTLQTGDRFNNQISWYKEKVGRYNHDDDDGNDN